MKAVRYIAIVLLMTLMGMNVEAQQRNVLQVPDVEVQIGSAQLPVVMENTDEIVGVQFDLTLPEGVTAEPVGTMGNRSDGHTVTMSRLSSGAYRVLLHSGQNRPLRGQSGVVMYLPVIIPDSFEEGSEHELSITNAVLGKSSGENVLTEVIAGKIHVSKLPDLTVKNITCDKQTAGPGDHILVSWLVENIGELATGGGWSEQVSLISEDGTTNKLITTTHYDNILDAGTVVSRQVEIALPTLLGLDGQTRLQVRIVPDSNTGESTSAQGNNTQTANTLLNINKVLMLALQPNRFVENNGGRIALKVSRSGSWASAETFSISATADSRVTVPSSITIPAKQSAAVLYLNVTDNDDLDNDSIITLSVEGNGYEKVSGKLVIEDNEYPNLSIAASQSVVTEGEAFTLTITTSRISTKPITVTLTSENSKRFTFPQTVTIPAGETSAQVSVLAVDDELPSLDLSNAFTVSAAGYNKGEVIVLLNDNDMPVLELTLTPSTVSESAGVVAVAGVLRRTSNTNSKITVKLSDDANGGLYFGNRTLELAKGVQEVHFNFGPVDNANVDGDRTYTITAAVWLSSCSCNASGESAGYVTAQLKVLDNDGPALGVTSSVSTVKEGGSTKLTISRNTTDNAEPLSVTISSDYDEGLSYSHTVVIPAGEQSVEVEVASASNGVQGDSRTVVFTVQADGYATGTCYLMVTDQTLPDAVITSISVNKSEVEAGGTTTVSITVNNGGTASLPKHTQIDYFISGNSLSIGTLYTTTDIAPGESETMTKIVRLPTVTGNKSLYCIVNNAKEVNELLYTNNTSNYLGITLLSPYRATVACNKKIYLPGDTIYFTGKIEGTANVNSKVELYLINDGSRQTLSVVTDNEGKFSSSYYPYDKQVGHFVIGACYPEEGLSIEQGAFDYIGLRRTSQKYITCEVIVGTPYIGTIEVENPTTLPQHNIRAEVLSAPENCSISFSPASEIGAGGKYSLNYVIEGTDAFEGTEWKSIKVRIVSDEGASMEVSMYCYCRLPEAQLTLDVTEINTTVTKGVPRDYPIAITNNGAGETGRIMLSLPSYIQTATSQDMASIKPGETATAILRLTTTEYMALNVPITGQIGINCENGNGLVLPFTVLPVAETNGTLIVDVCDEYTYYTKEAPHVKDAKVVVKYPYSDEIIATGFTDDNGIFSIELNEGYYALTVTADKHESYQNNLLIAPGKENKKVVNLSYEGITVNWNVKETEIEDEYEITTTVTYETNVPAPVVVTELPDYIPVDSMAPGESRLFYATLTNKGLIAAEGVQLIFPDIEYLSYEPLMELPVNILPQQSIVIPFKVTLSKNVTSEEDDDDVVRSRTAYPKKARKWKIVCEIKSKTLWFWICGSDHKKKWYETPIRHFKFKENCRVKMLEREDTESEEGGVPDGRGGFIWIGGKGGSNGKPVTDDKECLTCMEVLRDKAVDELIDMIPIVGCWINAARCSKDEVDKFAGGQLADIETISCAADAAGCVIGDKELMEACAAAGGGFGVAVCIGGKILKNLHDILKDLSKCMGFEWRADSRRKIIGDAQLTFAQAMDEKNAVVVRQIDAIIDYYKELFGDEAWLEVSNYDLWSLLKVLTTHKSTINASELTEFRPENISEEQFNTFVNRVNNTFFEGNNASGERINFANLKTHIDNIVCVEDSIIQQGCFSTTDMWISEYRKYQEILREETSSVCASITLEVKQTLTMTRPAFRGTLTVFNGHEDTAMTDVRLNIIVKDEDGNVATEKEFEMHAEPDGLKGFEGETTLPGGWTLEAQKEGEATVLFIPTKYAAPTTDKVYSFGGTLSYVDPFTGLEVTRDLIPVAMTVKPLPDLELTYLMQRDVYGDDPLTLDVVEPKQPAEFALIINNKGYGDATKVRMQTEQPKIVDNEKNLLVDIGIKSSQVNGDSVTLSLSKTVFNDFGNIPAHSQAYAQWWLESSLLGHFTTYEVEATHVTSYGNEYLSLIDTVAIHEMVHGFTLNSVHPTLNVPIRGYLVNDIVDADDLPDILYFTDATQQELHMAESAEVERLSETEYLLTVTPSQAGWNYGFKNDPTNGRQKLSKVLRLSDGVELSVDNIWQTDRTLRDGKEPLYENQLHFVGDINGGSESYLLTFEPKPDIELAVESYTGLPNEDTVLKEQLTEVTVKFNKPIVESSFTTDDITLNCQGEHLDATKIEITKVTDTEYRLGLNEVTLADGYYVLTVQTAGISDTEGFNGVTGKQASWIQFVDSKVSLTVSASPAEGGTVTPASGRFDYDSNVKLKAVPAEGYDFVGWTEYGETVSSDTEYTHHLIGNTNLTAQFVIKHYTVNIGYDLTQGVVEGAASGIYPFGTQLQFTAVPFDSYVFSDWVINDEIGSKTNPYTISVDRNMNIKALFVKQAATGIELSNNDVLRINIAPIPLGEYMYITGNFKEIRQINIYNMQGIKVISTKDVQQGVSVGRLNAGIYYVNISTEKGNYRAKVLKR